MTSLWIYILKYLYWSIYVSRNPIESPSPDRTDSKNSLDGDRSNDENVDQANLISTTVADTDPAIKNADQIALSKKKKKKKKKAKNIAVADSWCN